MKPHATCRPARSPRRVPARKRVPPCVRAGERSCKSRFQKASKKLKPHFQCSQQFSIVALTNASGAITERYAYSAYGKPVFCNASGTDISASAEDNRVLYTGREWEEKIKFYHFRARLYDAGMGRFLGRDPLGHRDSVNQYAFLSTRTLQRLDPTGQESLEELCDRKKKEYTDKRVPDLNRLCPNSDFEVDCRTCGEEEVNKGIVGFADCKPKILGGQKHTLVICLDSLRHGRTEEEAKKELITTIIHEDQHVADRCSCRRGCDAFNFTVIDIGPGGISNYCQRFYCTEVRAHSIDKSCDEHLTDEARRACIKDRIKDLYEKPHKDCTDADLDSAIEKCYIPKGQDPVYPMPIT